AQEGFGPVARLRLRPGADEDGEIAYGGVGVDRHLLLVRLERRVHVVREALEQREVRHCRDQASGEDDLEPADSVGESPEDEEEGRADEQREPDEPVRLDEVELQVDEEEEQRVELAS